MTTTQQSPNRKYHSILPIALASLLILGTARLVFDNLKNSRESIFRWRFWLEGNGFHRYIIKSSYDNDDNSYEDIEDCNVFEGKWVWDNVSRPLYSEESCPFLVKQVACQRNGRPDNFYQFWRWQPNDCNLPRFNALKLLRILRNKRLMFIGDSIQRSQFDSMVCMLQSALPQGQKSLHKEYNATIEFYWAPFIVESNSDHSTNHTVLKRLVKLDRIANHSKNWEGVDILVFESYVWWMYKPIINATYGNLNDIKEYNVTTAYKMALQTWANWLESSINSQTQRVYFMSLSPTHLWSSEWNPGSEGNCFNEKEPIHGPYWGMGTNLEIMKIVQETIQDLKIDVTFLNITQLSDFRKDAHTTIYTERKGKLLTKEQKADPKNFADCIHWCLPGVPDTWNEILYAHLLQEFYN
ncbi:protein trichome birefringence-like 31 isoform X2 [Beta vulgaris subsp. vulgaris]|uniref:protein trichome birefringence-like 31 isoform X2 n=1 Tax=Beta vulgaris subsp. vulgaris TaxID=3555 RepID=UPI002036D400|nr:protein trichome birefringence-like 31 isoform X2 [Beta vulgaris subsp. vulgaris]